MKVTSGCAGYYKIEAAVLNDDGVEVSRRVLADWFPNLITNQGLDYMGNSSDWLNACQVGTGAAVPAFTDTALAAYLAGTVTKQNVTSSIPGSAPYYMATNITFRFSAGVATGNLSEVGVGKTLASGNLYSRALILDGGGAPTTITVLANEVLDVTYSIRVYPPAADVTGIVTISGVNYNYTVRALDVNSPNGTSSGKWGIPNSGTSFTDGTDASMVAPGLAGGQVVFNGSMVPVTSVAPTGTSDLVNTITTAAYVGGSLQRDGTQTLDLNQGNLAGGITVVKFAFGWCAYQCGFSPAIPKDGTKTLTLTFRHSWSRAVIP